MGNCQHSSVQGDNYGETCMDCGEVLAGYGYWAEGQNECKHQFMPDETGKYEVCPFCAKTRPTAGE